MIDGLGIFDSESKTRKEILLPRGEEVTLSDSLLFRRAICFEGYDYLGETAFHLSFLTQFKPLSILGKYISTFTRNGLFSRRDLEAMDLSINEKGPFYLKLRDANN